MINGIDIRREPIAAKLQIGYVPDDHNLFSVDWQRLLKFIADMYQVSKPGKEIPKLLERFDMTAVGDLLRVIPRDETNYRNRALLHQPGLDSG